MTAHEEPVAEEVEEYNLYGAKKTWVKPITQCQLVHVATEKSLQMISALSNSDALNVEM